MSWKSHYLALDTETSGLSSQARILEFGVVEFKDGLPVRSGSLLFGPTGLEWTSSETLRALGVNHLSADECRQAPPFEAKYTEVLDMLSWAPVWVGHNLYFDLRMLRQEFYRLGQPEPKPELFGACTMSLDFTFDKFSRGWRLEEVAARYGLPNPSGAHRAEPDARRAGELFARMLESLPESVDEAKRVCNEAVDVWASTPKRR